MTPKEIVERVRTNQTFGRHYCTQMKFRDCDATAIHNVLDINHLLAIHAAAVEMFEARQGYLSDDGVVTVSGDQLTAAFANLADLCGWTGKEGV